MGLGKGWKHWDPPPTTPFGVSCSWAWSQVGGSCPAGGWGVTGGGRGNEAGPAPPASGLGRADEQLHIGVWRPGGSLCAPLSTAGFWSQVWLTPLGPGCTRVLAANNPVAPLCQASWGALGLTPLHGPPQLGPSPGSVAARQGLIPPSLPVRRAPAAGRLGSDCFLLPPLHPALSVTAGHREQLGACMRGDRDPGLLAPVSAPPWGWKWMWTD